MLRCLFQTLLLNDGFKQHKYMLQITEYHYLKLQVKIQNIHTLNICSYQSNFLSLTYVLVGNKTSGAA